MRWLRTKLKELYRTVRYYAVGLYHRTSEEHVFLTAGGLAFSIFVCIVPLVLIAFSVLGSILETSSVREEILSYIDDIVPYEQYAAYAREVVVSRMDEFRVYRSVAGYLGAIGLLLAASTLFSSMRTILNRTYRVEVDRSLVVAKLRDIGMVLLVLSFLLISVLSLPVLEIIKDSAGRLEALAPLQLSSLENVLFRLLSLALVFVFFFTLYQVIPYGRQDRRVTFISALWSTVLWEIAKQAFGYYISNVATLKRVYGTYVLLIVLAFWIYYSAIVFILGAQIGQLYRERQQTP